MSTITPTVGRKVWYWKGVGEALTQFSAEVPMDATVIYVWSETTVNLRVTDHAGEVHIRTSVQLRDPRDPSAVGGDSHGVEGRYATWMPYQVGQALRQAAPETPRPAEPEPQT